MTLKCQPGFSLIILSLIHMSKVTFSFSEFLNTVASKTYSPTSYLALLEYNFYYQPQKFYLYLFVALTYGMNGIEKTIDLKTGC